MRLRHVCLYLLCGLGVLACNAPANQASAVVSQPTSAVAAADLILPTDPPPTEVHPTPTSEASPTSAAAATIPTPEIDFDDLSPYRQAMLAEFTSDIDTTAATGVTQYYLEVAAEAAGIDPNQEIQLSGTERVRYTNTEDVPLAELYFRLYPNLPSYGGQMRVKTVIVDGRLVETSLEAEDSALRVPLPDPLAPGATVDVSLFFEATAPAHAPEGYNIFSFSNGTAALAGFYPVIAVYDEAGWDKAVPPPYGDATYLDAALYQVQLTVPDEMIVAASGSLVNRTLNGDGSQSLSLVSGPVRDFYLVMRTDFQVLSETVDGTVINSYYPPHLEAGAELALRYAADSLRIYNKLFGQYPFAELDIAATPTTAGGVEYPGIIVVSERLYGQEGGFFQQATSHEVAHQWWYSLVGNDQIDEPWLDEALTNYSTVFYWEEVAGQAGANAVIDSFFLKPYQRAQSQGADRSVIGSVADFSEPEYSVFIYGKGPLFFDALRREVGDDIFVEILRTYFADNRYKVATADDLLSTIETISGRSIEPLIETWLQGE